MRGREETGPKAGDWGLPSLSLSHYLQVRMSIGVESSFMAFHSFYSFEANMRNKDILISVAHTSKHPYFL